MNELSIEEQIENLKQQQAQQLLQLQQLQALQQQKQQQKQQQQQQQLPQQPQLRVKPLPEPNASRLSSKNPFAPKLLEQQLQQQLQQQHNNQSNNEDIPKNVSPSHLAVPQSFPKAHTLQPLPQQPPRSSSPQPTRPVI